MVECIVCFNKFASEGLFVPMGLVCGHSICYQCLTASDRIAHCPTCQHTIDSDTDPLSKNYALIALIDSMAPPKNKTACSNCKNNFDFVKEEMLVCISCSIQREPAWMDKPDAEENCFNYRLCAFCIFKTHSTSDHLIKPFSELQNILAASRCGEILAVNVSSFYSEVQHFIDGDYDVVQVFKQTIEEAISYLKNSKRKDDLCITRDDITKSIDRVQNSLDTILGTHRVEMNAIKKTTLDIKDHLPGEYSSRIIKKESEGILKVQNILNTVIHANEKRLTAEFLNCNVSSDESLIHEAVYIFITKTMETIENPSLRSRSQLYARVCKAQIEADLQQAAMSPFRDNLLNTLQNEFFSLGTIISREEKSLMASIINCTINNVQQELINKLGEIFLKPRTRMLGIMRLITELFLIKVFDYEVMTSCLLHLTSKCMSTAAPFSVRDENSILCVCECLDVIRSSDCYHEMKSKYDSFVFHLKKAKSNVSKSTRYIIKILCEKWELENSQIEDQKNPEFNETCVEE